MGSESKTSVLSNNSNNSFFSSKLSSARRLSSKSDQDVLETINISSTSSLGVTSNKNTFSAVTVGSLMEKSRQIPNITTATPKKQSKPAETQTNLDLKDLKLMAQKEQVFSML